MDAPDLKAPQHYINRELSFLEFNQRVLDQAFDESVPLLERLRFLCISCSNLDEFFEIRVAGLKQLQELGGGQLAADAMSIPEQLAAIHDRTTQLIADQYRCLNGLLLPKLTAEGVPLLERSDWSPEQSEWLEQYFEREIEPVLSPLGLDPARPFPRIQNKSSPSCRRRAHCHASCRCRVGERLEPACCFRPSCRCSSTSSSRASK